MKKIAISSLKVTNLKSINVVNEQFKNLINNLSFTLNANNILGFVGGDSETNNLIFNYLTNNTINPKRYQGYIEFQTNLGEYSSIYKNSNYQNNIAFGFYNDILNNDLNEDNSYRNIKKYINHGAVIGALTEEFVSQWKPVFQDYKLLLQSEFAKLQYGVEIELGSKLDDLFSELSQFDLRNIDAKNLKFDTLFKKFKDIEILYRTHEMKLFAFVNATIAKYNKGLSFLKRKEYLDSKKEYEEVIKKIYKPFSKPNRFLNRVRFFSKFLETKKSSKSSIKKFVNKLRRDLNIENYYYKYELKKTIKQSSFIHFYKNLYFNGLLLKFINKNLKAILGLKEAKSFELLYEIFDLKNNITNEVNVISNIDNQKELKNEIKAVIKNNFLNDVMPYIERIKASSYEHTQEVINDVTREIQTSNNYDLNIGEFGLANKAFEKLKTVESKYKDAKNEYFWNYKTEGNAILKETKKVLRNFNKYSKINSHKLMRLKLKIFNLINLIKIKEFNNSVLNEQVKKIKENLQFLKILRNEFDSYKYVVSDFKTASKKQIKLFVSKINIYKIIAKANIDVNFLVEKLGSLSDDEKIRLECEKILINNPSLIIIGPNISKLPYEKQCETLNQLNKFVLDNHKMAIYFLDNINIAQKITTDLYIINSSKIIEQGKTSQLIRNPINPIVKNMLNYKDEKTQEDLSFYMSQEDNMENIYKYEIEPYHFVWCTWSELNRWINANNVKNKELMSLFIPQNTFQSKGNKTIDNKEPFEETTLINLIDDEDNELRNLNMEKTFNHKIVEKDRCKKWNDMKIFQTHDESKKPFTIILPPPNVTGNLHIGHALDNYISDTIIRFKKLQGYDVLWLPGTDHAGIATQAVVEKKLASQNINKYQLGREEFIKKVWEWVDEYSKNIHNQWQKLGLALDYGFERFTLDDNSNEAVLKVFIELYENGLIYRDEKAINWDPVLETALSNIEVVPKETKQKMYYIKYPIKNSENFLEVATTRPETMFSDVALAINPQDSRANQLIKEIIIHPLTNKEIPIILSNKIDPNFGSGIMKVSAHAVDDIEIIIENKLPINECINKDGKLNDLAGEFKGLDRFEAREKIAHLLSQKGLLIKEEEVVSNIGYSERSKAPIEILVQPQWFVKMSEFSKMLLKDLRSDEGVKIFPPRFESTLENWMENAHDWTISRQIWWGHRIPAWYNEQNEIKVQIQKPEGNWKQDDDVLDTWFSSGLAPFVFLGWPQDKSKLKRYFPTSLLVTGYDIIFFWVARMYFFSLYFMDQKPFEHLLLHGLVRDSQGRKMSKSLGNGINPIQVIDEYGSDVLRMSLIFNCTPGLDINYSDEKIQGAKLFANKFWNIARFVENIPVSITEKIDFNKLDEYDNWILNEYLTFKKNIEDAMDKYELTIIYKHIQDFVVDKFSNWYLEFLKFKENSYLIHYLFKQILILLHPFMPFLTDYVFEKLYHEELLCSNLQTFALNKESSNNTPKIISLITALRKYREDKKISKSIELFFYLNNLVFSSIDLKIINKLSNFSWKENHDFSLKTESFEVFIIQSKQDKENEILELNKLIEFSQKEIEFNEKLINNPKFMEKANKNTINEKLANLKLHKEKLEFYKNQLKEKQEKIN